MSRVLGLGGVFLKADDPAALAAWYRRHLELDVQDFGGTFGAVLKLQPEERGYQVYSLFARASTYFPGAVMVSFRVADLARLLATLRAEGVTVTEAVDDPAYGKFGWITDPEGNRVELWQPP